MVETAAADGAQTDIIACLADRQTAEVCRWIVPPAPPAILTIPEEDISGRVLIAFQQHARGYIGQLTDPFHGSIFSTFDEARHHTAVAQPYASLYFPVNKSKRNEEPAI